MRGPAAALKASSARAGRACAGGAHLKVLAEQTGGDAVQLCAPVQWQGDEAGWLADQPFAAALTPGLHLAFACHSILVRLMRCLCCSTHCLVASCAACCSRTLCVSCWKRA